MTDQPTLLFLHGVGAGDQGNNWLTVLNQSFGRIDHPEITKSQIIAPKYPFALKGVDDEVPLPKLTTKVPGGEAARQNRREFERRMGAIEIALGSHDRGGAGTLGAEKLMQVALGAPYFFKQANNYLNNKKVRAHVLTKILQKLPSSGRLVIVGHSLGSVIAADLIRRLPPDLEVVGMVTIGSPLAGSPFHVEKLRSALAEPPTNLGWWVNIWDFRDPVTSQRGVSSLFPWMIDVRVKTPLSAGVHYASTYLATEMAAEAIGRAFFGSRSKELAIAESGVDIRLNHTESVALLALRYAHLAAAHLKGEKQERFVGALRQVQAKAVGRICDHNAETMRPTPAAVSRLSVDLSKPDSPTVVPTTIRHLSRAEALVPLLTLASENVLRPYEIEVPPAVWGRAMEQLTLEMGLGRQFGRDVFQATLRARGIFKGETNWFKWATVSVGVAALVAGTGGLALVAAPGVAGAAAVTSALAAFGPGGMVGGLLTAGTLVSAGGGGLAIGLASPSTTAQTVQAMVVNQLATVMLRDMQGIEQDPTIWEILSELDVRLRREHARLGAYSDESSPSLKELKAKILAVEKTLAYMLKHDLAPSARPSVSTSH